MFGLLVAGMLGGPSDVRAVVSKCFVAGRVSDNGSPLYILDNAVYGVLL